MERPTPESPVPSSAQGHSEEYFGAYRDFWWNRDFLELMARRLRLDECGRILDLGCGAGHWTRSLLPFFSEDAWIIAADRDLKWSAADVSWAQDLRELGVSIEVHQADATKLPFADGSFDLVTCQTLLIHLKEPRRALGEMLRVLKPGGLLLCAEPDNFGVFSARDSLTAQASLEEAAQAFKFELAQQRGREALGLGNISIGGLLPGLFSEFGLRDIQVHLSDKANPRFPPYASEEQIAMLEETEHWFSSTPDASKERVRACYLAGGGLAEEFEGQWARAQSTHKRYLESVRSRQFHCAGGTLLYLVSGEKPPARSAP